MKTKRFLRVGSVQDGRTDPDEPNRTGVFRVLSGGDQVAGPGIVSIAPTVGAPHEGQPTAGAIAGVPHGAHAGSHGGAQVAGGGTRAPRVKHDSQPTAGANRTKTAVAVNSLRMICSLSIRLAASGAYLQHGNSTP